MMFYSKPYNYYKDKDYKNLGPKMRYGFKSSIEFGAFTAAFNMMFFNKPKNFAHLFYIAGKWVGITALIYTSHSALTYTIAKESNHDGPRNHFLGALAPGLFARFYFGNAFAMMIATVVYGGFAAHQKDKMQNFNTANGFDESVVRGLGGLYEGQFSMDTPLTRLFFERKDPGLRESDRTT